jgi:glycosyltransferase involved in cell wall biosynthesis
MMGDRSVLYVVPLYVEGVREHFEMSNYSLAGESKRHDVIETLHANGDDVTVVAPILANDGLLQYRSGTVVSDKSLNINVHAPPAIGGGYLQYLILTLMTTLLTLKLTVTRDIDVIMFYNFQLRNTLPALSAKAVGRLPVILQYEDGLFVDPEAPMIIRVLARLLRLVFGQWIDGVVAVNQKLANVIPTENAVVFPRFPAVGMPGSLPERSYDDAGQTTVMFAGRFDRYRGVDTFINTVPAVTARTDDVIFWVAGYGSDHDRKRVQQRIGDLNDQGQSIRYLGTVSSEEYRSRVCEADILVSLHDSERLLSNYTYPTKLIHFMASGGTVISNPIDDPAAPPSNAIVYTDGSTESIVETIVDCVDCYSDYEDTARRGQSWIEASYGREVITNDIDTLLMRAMS